MYKNLLFWVSLTALAAFGAITITSGCDMNLEGLIAAAQEFCVEGKRCDPALLLGTGGSGGTSGEPCGSVTIKGRCDGNTVVFCLKDQLEELDCTPKGRECGIDPVLEYYDCLDPDGSAGGNGGSGSSSAQGAGGTGGSSVGGSGGNGGSGGYSYRIDYYPEGTFTELENMKIKAWSKSTPGASDGFTWQTIDCNKDESAGNYVCWLPNEPGIEMQVHAMVKIEAGSNFVSSCYTDDGKCDYKVRGKMFWVTHDNGTGLDKSNPVQNAVAWNQKDASNHCNACNAAWGSLPLCDDTKAGCVP